MSLSQSVPSLSMRYRSRQSSAASSWVALDEDTLGSSDDEILWPTTTSESESGAHEPEADDEDEDDEEDQAEQDDDRDDYVLLSPARAMPPHLANLSSLRISDSDAEDDRDMQGERSILATPTQAGPLKNRLYTKTTDKTKGAKKYYHKPASKSDKPASKPYKPASKPYKPASRYYTQRQKYSRAAPTHRQVETLDNAVKPYKWTKTTEVPDPYATAYPSPSPSPVRASKQKHTIAKAGKTKKHYYWKNRKIGSPAPAPPIGLGARPVVDDTADGVYLTYEDASRMMTSYLAQRHGTFPHSPPLPVMHALLVELSVLQPTDTPPRSRTAAKLLFKHHTFVSARAYLKARGGPQSVLVDAAVHQSRSALRRAMISGDGPPPAPRWWVKDRGLQVLLISTRFAHYDDDQDDEDY